MKDFSEFVTDAGLENLEEGVGSAMVLYNRAMSKLDGISDRNLRVGFKTLAKLQIIGLMMTEGEIRRMIRRK